MKEFVMLLKVRKEKVVMNIYDTANKLASEIRTSEEYVNYKMAREVINLRPDLKEEIAKFEQLR